MNAGVRLVEAAQRPLRRDRLQPAGLRGRVEDTVNLLGHAARKVAECAADLLGWKADRVAEEAGIPVLRESSVKMGLDRMSGTEAAMTDAVSTTSAAPS